MLVAQPKECGAWVNEMPFAAVSGLTSVLNASASPFPTLPPAQVRLPLVTVPAKRYFHYAAADDLDDDSFVEGAVPSSVRRTIGLQF